MTGTHSPGSWALRFAGLRALVNAVGFGAFDVPAIWHLAHEHTVRNALDNPTYGHGPSRRSGFPAPSHCCWHSSARAWCSRSAVPSC